MKKKGYVDIGLLVVGLLVLLAFHLLINLMPKKESDGRELRESTETIKTEGASQ